MKYLITLSFVFTLSLKANSQIVDMEPDWSPDGKSIVFVRTGPEITTSLYIRSLQDGTERPIPSSAKGHVLNPTWSPSGNYIAFASNSNRKQDLFYYDLRNNTTIQLTNSAEIDATPVWWSDDLLSFVRYNPKDKSRRNFKVDLKGKEEQFTPAASLEAIYTSVSPLGDQMIFGGKPLNSDEQFHLYSKNLATGAIKQLEDKPLVSYNPSWFPDGKQLAFIHQDDQTVASAAIYIYNFEKDSMTKALGCEAGCYHPRVSPDGKQIMYLDGWGRKSNGIFLLNVATGETTKLN